MPPDSTFQQSLNDVQTAEIRLINQTLTQIKEEQTRQRQEMRELFAGLRDDVRTSIDRIEKRLDAHDKDIGDMKLQQARLQERLTISNMAQAAFATFIGGIAAFIGYQK